MIPGFPSDLNRFQVRDDEFWCGEVPLRTLAEECGTRLYACSRATVERHFATFDGAFASVPHPICHAVKANSKLAVLSLPGPREAGMDVVSDGEIIHPLRARAAPRESVEGRFAPTS